MLSSKTNRHRSFKFNRVNCFVIIHIWNQFVSQIAFPQLQYVAIGKLEAHDSRDKSECSLYAMSNSSVFVYQWAGEWAELDSNESEFQT